MENINTDRCSNGNVELTKMNDSGYYDTGENFTRNFFTTYDLMIYFNAFLVSMLRNSI